MFHKRLLKEFKENRKLVAGMVAAQWMMLMANVGLMLVTADFIAALFYDGVRPERVIRLTVVLLLVLMVRGVLSAWNNKLSFDTSKQLKGRLRTLLYEKLMRMGSGYREKIKTSEAVQISTEGVEQLEIYFGRYIPQFFYSMLAPLTLFVITGLQSLKVAAVLLLCVPLIPLSIVAVQKFAKKMLAKYWGTYTELGDSFLECLQGLTTLKIYRADERYAEKMEEESEKFRKVTMRVLIMQLNSISVMDLVAYGGAGIGIILSLLELKSGKIGLFQCFFLIMISAEFFLPLRLLGSFFHIAMNGTAAADKIFRLLDEAEPEPGGLTEEKKWKNTIAFRDVSFSYDGEKQVLNGISLEAGKGLTALVGESGCGKSTLVSLMMGELLPERGGIRIGDEESVRIRRDALYRKMTRIRHDSYLFAGTVRENLLMGKPDAAEKELFDALKQVNLYEFVRANGGLDMVLSEKASNLSVGQKQRLALARALLHDTDIYLFDEATSNVDVKSENDIMAVVKRLAAEKTVILISHRLANVTEADHIYVMKDGGVAEDGRHEELLAKTGYYHSLFSGQRKLEQYGKERTAYGA